MVFIPPSIIALEKQKKTRSQNLQILVGTVAVIGGGYLLWDVTAAWLKENAQKKAAPPAAAAFSAIPAGESESVSEDVSVAPAPRDVLPLAIPPKATLQQESAASPGEPPASLVQFADNLSARMEVAEGNVEKAKELFKDLTDCVSGAVVQANVGIQALCLAHAEELADSYPELFQGKFLELYRSAPTDVSRVLDEGDLD